MSERMIWVVRLIGIIVFLVLMYLLMSLHSRLVKMNEEQGKLTTLGGKSNANLELRVANRDGASMCMALNAVDGVRLDRTRRVRNPQFAVRNPQSHPL